jgi:hypothetical protein
MFYEKNYSVFPHVLIFFYNKIRKIKSDHFTVEYKKKVFFLNFIF